MVDEEAGHVSVGAVAREDDVTFLRLVVESRAVAVGLVCVPQTVEDEDLYVRARVLSNILWDINDDHCIEREQQHLAPCGLGVNVAVADANR